MTLLEVLLALGVVAMLTALAWPSVMRLQGEQKILDSAEKVRALVATARVHAIESGLAYQFRYEVNGSHFLVIPFEPEFEAVDARTGGAGTAEGLGRFSKATGKLPDGVTFDSSSNPNLSTVSTTASTNSTLGTGQQLSSDALNGLPDAGKLAGLTWSGPLLFQPDGSATADSEFSVIDRRNQRITLRVRGVTGGVSVGRLQREDRL